MDRTVQLDGTRYTYRAGRWVESKTNMRPPAAIMSRLNALIRADLEEEDAAITDVQELLDRSKAARDVMQESRAAALARRALELDPANVGAAVVLCSALRALKDPEEALRVSGPFRQANYAPLVTCRAAALCDVGRWEEALKAAKRAYAIQGGRDGTAGPGLVMNRIREARPDLFDEP